MAAAVDAASSAPAISGQSRRRGRGLVDYPDVERSSLHRSLDEGRFQSVFYQVKLGMDPNVRSRQGLTPLMRCARIRPLATSLQLIRALLDREANPDLTDTRGNNLLQLAVKEGNVALVKLLLTENNVNFHHRDTDGDTVLHLLANQSAEICRMVLQAAKRFHIDCDVVNSEGLTPMMAACRAGNLPVVEAFAITGGASFTKRDERHRKTAQEWLMATVGPGGINLKMEQLRRRQQTEATSLDPYAQIRQSRRMETLTRLFQNRHHSTQADTAAGEEEATGGSSAGQIDAAPPVAIERLEQLRPSTAVAAVTARSLQPQSMAGGSVSSRLLCGSAPPPNSANQRRLLSGIFNAYELQLSSSYCQPAIVQSVSTTVVNGDGGGHDDSRSSGSRPLSRGSSGSRSMRSPILALGGLGFQGSNPVRRMTDFAGNIRKQRIRSGVRMSEAGIGSSDASNSLLLNTSQDSGGLRRQSSRI